MDEGILFCSSYIGLAATKYNHPIPIIAAAGNDTTTGHLSGRVCSTQSNFDNTFLGELRWYYPACFAPTATNIISVTGMNDISHPCYYQNFSRDLITVGVINNLAANHLCCSYRPGYMSDLGIMEGSSFATPVISGRIISSIIQNGFRTDMRDYLRGHWCTTSNNAWCADLYHGRPISSLLKCITNYYYSLHIISFS